MARISSFKLAAGMIGITALVKVSVFAIALAMLGTGGSLVSSPGQTSMPNNSQIAARY